MVSPPLPSINRKSVSGLPSPHSSKITKYSKEWVAKLESRCRAYLARTSSKLCNTYHLQRAYETAEVENKISFSTPHFEQKTNRSWVQPYPRTTFALAMEDEGMVVPKTVPFEKNENNDFCFSNGGRGYGCIQDRPF